MLLAGEICAAGGSNSSSVAQSTVEWLNMTANAWVMLPNGLLVADHQVIGVPFPLV